MPRKSTKRKAVQRVVQKSFVDTFAEDMDSREPDMIHGMYGSVGHSLGVTKVFYSGLPTLDRCMAIKRDTNLYGMPLNKIIELFGSEQAGKTTMALYMCVQIIKQGGLAYFVDFEHKFDPAWLRVIAKQNGVSEELLKRRFRYVDPQHMEGFIKWLLLFMKKIIADKAEARKGLKALNEKKKKAADHDEQVARCNEILNTPFIIVVDSIASIYTKDEMEGKKKDGKPKDVTDQKVAELANLFNRVLKHIRFYLGYTDTLILFLNQIRDNIQTNSFLAKFASKIKTPGGNAVKHFSDGRMQIIRIGSIKRTRNKIAYVIGAIFKLKVVKNQMGMPPFMETNVKLLHDRGFFSNLDVLDALAQVGKVKRKGNLYLFLLGGVEHAVHESDADEFFDENPKIAESLHKVYQTYMRKISA